jgi:hypothetical protein
VKEIILKEEDDRKNRKEGACVLGNTYCRGVGAKIEWSLRSFIVGSGQFTVKCG